MYELCVAENHLLSIRDEIMGDLRGLVSLARKGFGEEGR
jgi:hypothetical protein